MMGLIRAPHHDLCFEPSKRALKTGSVTQGRSAFFGSWTRSINQSEALEKL